MGHSYIRNHVHCVFSTKERQPLISPDLQPRLWKFLLSVAESRGFTIVAIGGTDNHLHVLLGLPPTMNLAKVIQTIKGVSSKWINDEFSNGRKFAWQEGYGAFSVAASQVERTVEYIRNQAEHHRKRTFEEEFVAFLKRNNVDYDPKYIFG